ncbi:MAG TPA: VCBS repeat-containing protein, partial [Planctomycetes bacterium]|nr:VCBS repeat-containing protein [Planctomycetota bacterium]
MVWVQKVTTGEQFSSPRMEAPVQKFCIFLLSLTFTTTIEAQLPCSTFTDSGQLLGSFYSASVALGDLDGDGVLDAFVANSGQPNRVYMNDGTGTYPDSGQFLGSSWSTSVALGDLDDDGDLDAFVANSTGQPNRVYLNQGGLQLGTTGTFSDSGQVLGSFYSRSVALGDLDGDGDLDAFV